MTERPQSDRPRRVGVLSFHNNKETKAILNAIEALGHEPVWLREENMETWMADGTVRYEPDVNVVGNRLLLTKALRPLEDLGVAGVYIDSRPVLNPPSAVLGAVHKATAATSLVAAGIPVPDVETLRELADYTQWLAKWLTSDTPLSKCNGGTSVTRWLLYRCVHDTGSHAAQTPLSMCIRITMEDRHYFCEQDRCIVGCRGRGLRSRSSASLLSSAPK